MIDYHPRSSSISPQDFLERLQRHPDLQPEITDILEIVEIASGDASNADDAVERVARELYRLGQQAL